jgi:hypothetical protein
MRERGVGDCAPVIFSARAHFLTPHHQRHNRKHANGKTSFRLYANQSFLP